MNIGEMASPRDMFLHQVVGSAESEGKKYSMLLINMHLPAVRSESTGKTFMLPWNPLCDLAQLAGVDADQDVAIFVSTADDVEEGT